MRKEKDSLGDILVNDEKFWGASTQRTLQNFSIGEEKLPLEVIYAFAIIKKASATANYKLKLLSKEKKDLIIFATEEILQKKLDDHFPLFIWQTGSGTSTNMNVNEVITNLAKMKKQASLHPNDEVNMGQSSNDTFPAAMNISAYILAEKNLLKSLNDLKKGFDKKAKEFKNIIKVGRTHLMDAVPITLGAEFSAFSHSITESIDNINLALKKLLYLPLGATAVGTGLNTHVNFSKLVTEEISKITGIKFLVAKNFYHSLSFSDAILNLSSTLKNLASSLFKIANDIALLASGPKCGLSEIILPAIEPGSSIMPGKVNPSLCEALKMVAMQVISNDNLITLANTSGNFQLNTSRTVQIYNLIQSINLLTDISKTFLNNCLLGIKPNLEKIKENLDKNLMIATALNKVIGYEKASKIVFFANQENLTLKEAAKRLNMIDENKFDEMVNVKKLLHPFNKL